MYVIIVIGRTSISDTKGLELLDFRNAINQVFVSPSILGWRIDRASVVIYLSMKLVVLILTFLAVSIELGNCQYDYSYGDEYAYDDYPAPPPPRRPRGRGYRVVVPNK